MNQAGQKAEHENLSDRGKRNFVNYIHNFRGLAIIFVVAGHLLLNWPEGSTVYKWFRVVWENGTVLFIFIAGYLFQHLSARFSYPDYLKKKFRNVILPYLLVSIPIIIYRVVQSDFPGYIFEMYPDFSTWPVYKKVATFYLNGSHMQQLWFIPMIFCFYIIAPLLIYMDRHPKLYYLIILFVGVSLIIEREPFSDIPRMFVHFISVYVFGMLLSRYKDRVLKLLQKMWLPLTLITLLAVILNYIYFEEYGFVLSYIHKMLFCAFFIYWLWRLDKYVPKFFSVLADLSFGIFFIHYYVLLIVKAIYEKQTGHPIPGSIIYWTLNFILVMVLSVLAVQLIKKITGKKSRYFVGC
ncbi:MAG: acyltransferase [Chitinophagaceae bacterium]|nr:acyltransferase [Chitinophagaceae bacterium]